MSYRIYINDDFTSSTLVNLSEEDSHYLINVLRLKEGQLVRIFNEKFGEYSASLYKVSKKGYALKIESKLRDVAIQSKLSIALALIKNDKFLWALEKATELGVTEIYPLICERSQYSTINMERSFKCLKEAAEQSERFDIPCLHEPVSLKNFLINHKKLIICSEKASKEENLSKIPNINEDICFIIGPEGGFSDNEFKLMSSLQHISLGQNILRAETAVIALTSQVQLLRMNIQND